MLKLTPFNEWDYLHSDSERSEYVREVQVLMASQIRAEMELAHGVNPAPNVESREYTVPWITNRDPTTDGSYLVRCESRDEHRDTTYRYVRIEVFENGEWVRGGYYTFTGWYPLPSV
jgi:hypothetical protein